MPHSIFSGIDGRVLIAARGGPRFRATIQRFPRARLEASRSSRNRAFCCSIPPAWCLSIPLRRPDTWTPRLRLIGVCAWAANLPSFQLITMGAWISLHLILSALQKLSWTWVLPPAPYAEENRSTRGVAKPSTASPIHPRFHDDDSSCVLRTIHLTLEISTQQGARRPAFRLRETRFQKMQMHV
jgi:hypothetical protein